MNHSPMWLSYNLEVDQLDNHRLDGKVASVAQFPNISKNRQHILDSTPINFNRTRNREKYHLSAYFSLTFLGLIRVFLGFFFWIGGKGREKGFLTRFLFILSDGRYQLNCCAIGRLLMVDTTCSLRLFSPIGIIKGPHRLSWWPPLFTSSNPHWLNSLTHYIR